MGAANWVRVRVRFGLAAQGLGLRAQGLDLILWHIVCRAVEGVGPVGDAADTRVRDTSTTGLRLRLTVADRLSLAVMITVTVTVMLGCGLITVALTVTVRHNTILSVCCSVRVSTKGRIGSIGTISGERAKFESNQQRVLVGCRGDTGSRKGQDSHLHIIMSLSNSRA